MKMLAYRAAVFCIIEIWMARNTACEAADEPCVPLEVQRPSHLVLLTRDSDHRAIIYDAAYGTLASEFIKEMEYQEYPVVQWDIQTFYDLIDDYIIGVKRNVNSNRVILKYSFLLLCNIYHAQKILSYVGHLDDTVEDRSFLRHFSKWVIISLDDGGVIPTMNVTFDNIAVVTTKKYDNQTGSDIQLKILPQQLLLNDTEIATLLWRAGGRAWSPIKLSDVCQSSWSSTIFPNTARGLNGRKLTIAALEWLATVKKEIVDGKTRYVGFGMDVVNHLAGVFNFSYEVVEPADQLWGTELPNETWTGIIGMLQRQNADMCPIPYFINYRRGLVVDFSFPIATTDGVAIYNNLNSGNVEWKSVLIGFKWEVYLCLCLSILAISILAYVMEYAYKRKKWALKEAVTEAIEIGVHVPLRQGLIHLPRHQSSRILFSLWCIFCVIISAAFTGNLVALVSVSKETVLFSTLSQMAQQDDFKIASIPGSYSQIMFKHSNDHVFRTLSKKIEETLEGQDEARAQSIEYQKEQISHGKYVLITNAWAWDTITSDTCHVVKIKEIFLSNYLAFLFPRNSPLVDLFNEELMYLVESGIMDRLVTKWKPRRKLCLQEEHMNWIHFQHLWSIVVACALGVASATCVLIIEIILNQSKMRTH